MRVAFRVDASIEIGSGHVMRCLALANKLKARGVEVIFISRMLPGHLGGVIEKNGFVFLSLPPVNECVNQQRPDIEGVGGWLMVAPELDSEQCIAQVFANGGVDWMVVDHYGIDQRWESMMRVAAQSIMVIDDLANRSHDCDLLLDQNFVHAADRRYTGLVPERCRCLLGPRYALLRDEFVLASQDIRVRDGNIDNVLLFMGGMDSMNTTEMVVMGLMQLHETNLNVDVVVGIGNPYRQRIVELCQSDARFSLHTQIDNMAEFLNRADLVIGAPGSSSWERALLGVPAVVVILAENQRPIAESLQQYGAVVVAGSAESLRAENIAQIVSELKQRPEEVESLSKSARTVMADYSDGSAEVADLICS